MGGGGKLHAVPDLKVCEGVRGEGVWGCMCEGVWGEGGAARCPGPQGV